MKIPDKFKDGIYTLTTTKKYLAKLQKTTDLKILDTKGNPVLTFRNVEFYNTERKLR